MTPIERPGNPRDIDETEDGRVIINEESSERADEIMGGLSKDLGVKLRRVD